jgi:octaprenyl-diphosphate synthase
VVDEADMRHNQQSVNRRWSSRVAVITGDYILARSFTEGMHSGEYDIVEYITSCMAFLAEVELIQMDNTVHRGYSRECYLDIISRKTAALLSTSAGLGAMSVRATVDEIEKAKRIGEMLGMAFQIKDDILDFAPASQTGKPQCADLREGKITLPMITILERIDETERQLLLSRIASIDELPEEVGRLSEFVDREGGIKAATEIMNDYLGEARQLLLTIEPSEYRTSMLLLVDYIGEREK